MDATRLRRRTYALSVKSLIQRTSPLKKGTFYNQGQCAKLAFLVD